MQDPCALPRPNYGQWQRQPAPRRIVRRSRSIDVPSEFTDERTEKLRFGLRSQLLPQHRLRKLNGESCSQGFQFQACRPGSGLDLDTGGLFDFFAFAAYRIAQAPRFLFRIALALHPQLFNFVFEIGDLRPYFLALLLRGFPCACSLRYFFGNRRRPIAESWPAKLGDDPAEYH